MATIRDYADKSYLKKVVPELNFRLEIQEGVGAVLHPAPTPPAPLFLNLFYRTKEKHNATQ